MTVSLNAEATIEDTLASVAGQNADFSFEHVCVDGGSSDSTRAVIDRWAAKQPTLVRVYEPDSGIFDAMNKGLKIATGEYLLYLNSDDFFADRHCLAVAMAGLSARTSSNPDLVLGDVAMGIPEHRGFWRHRRAPSLLARVRGTGLFPVHPAQLTKRSLLIASGGFNSRLRLAADVTQFYDLERKQRLTFRILRKDLTVMRPGGSANANLSAMKLGTLEIFEHLLRRHGYARSAVMVGVKSLQSLLEVRYGLFPYTRWFALMDGT